MLHPALFHFKAVSPVLLPMGGCDFSAHPKNTTARTRSRRAQALVPGA